LRPATPGGSAVLLIVEALAKGELVWAHAFEFDCAKLGIEHRLTKPRHPWTNGQVERMNRTIKEATVKRYHYENHAQLERHLADFVLSLQFRPPAEDAQRASHPTSSSASSGQSSPNASGLIRFIKCRD